MPDQLRYFLKGTFQRVLFKEYFSKGNSHRVLFKGYFPKGMFQRELFKGYFSKGTFQRILFKGYFSTRWQKRAPRLAEILVSATLGKSVFLAEWGFEIMHFFSGRAKRAQKIFPLFAFGISLFL